ncbi:hypothetical protein ACEWPL_018155 [Roseovarius sp. S1116L3]|uniref:hypothetical protein n=1 Tax=Roseovarius roseus TaxID=3342636 RepID=UPI00372B1115
MLNELERSHWRSRRESSLRPALSTLSNAFISLAQQMAGSVNLRCGVAGHRVWQLWAGSDDPTVRAETAHSPGQARRSGQQAKANEVVSPKYGQNAQAIA